jgi:hypothetical protein
MQAIGITIGKDIDQIMGVRGTLRLQASFPNQDLKQSS